MINSFISSKLYFFGLVLACLGVLDLYAQNVSSYAQDGKIKDMKGKVQQDIVVAKDGSGDFLYWYGYPKDTSFSLNSAYEKEKKGFPHIRPVISTNIAGVMESSDHDYKDLGYRSLKMDVFYPERNGGPDIPGILFVHGGGWKSGTKELQIPLAKALAKKGFVTAVVEYRLSLEAKYPAAVYDVKEAIKWFKANGDKFGLDTNRVVISGSSAGAQLATLVAFTSGQSDYEENSITGATSKVHAVINMDGVLAFHHPESAEGEIAAFWLGGTYDEVPHIWEAASPLYQVSINAVPVLFINSQFSRFHAGRDDLIYRLDQFGIYSEIHTVQESPHTFWLFDPWFETVVCKADDFIRKIFGKN